MIVLDELDRFKEKPGILGESARYINRFLDSLRSEGRLDLGVTLPTGQTIKANNLKICEKIMEISSFLISNQFAYKFKNELIIKFMKQLELNIMKI